MSVEMLLVSKKSIPTFLSTIICCFLLFAACQPDRLEDIVIEEEIILETRSFPLVDERLWPYFERFETEGKARGITVDLVSERISGVIEDLDGEHIAGQCNTYSGAHPNHVIMDLGFWNQANDLFKEFIIFHELGHCFLDRDHREDAFTNGRCVSLMRSGVGDCRDNYNLASRASYINELFKPESVD